MSAIEATSEAAMTRRFGSIPASPWRHASLATRSDAERVAGNEAGAG